MLKGYHPKFQATGKINLGYAIAMHFLPHRKSADAVIG